MTAARPNFTSAHMNFNKEIFNRMIGTIHCAQVQFQCHSGRLATGYTVFDGDGKEVGH